MLKRRTGSEIEKELKTISEKCINCELCTEECGFLKKYGKPKEIADGCDPLDKQCLSMGLECSLCQLCAAVCPVQIDPSAMFMEMRRETVRRGNDDFSKHNGILNYERRGTSKRYTWYALPKGCDTIFFPGCTLPGTRPDKTIELYAYMRKQIPTMGIVLDCCTKPSYDMGREGYFEAMFGEMKDFLIKSHIQHVYVSCPNCYKIFKKYGTEFSIQTVYEFIAQNGLPSRKQINETITIHDPCAVRFEKQIHAAVRELVVKQGLVIKEMPHCRETAYCCGEGGAVECVSFDLSSNWGILRKNETNSSMTIAYCAGCTNHLNRITPTSHILDLLFEPEATLAGKVKVSKSPMTYLNRLKLKYRLKRTVDASISRERTFDAVV
jgi:Fe-S oxidoreductase